MISEVAPKFDNSGLFPDLAFAALRILWCCGISLWEKRIPHNSGFGSLKGMNQRGEMSINVGSADGTWACFTLWVTLTPAFRGIIPSPKPPSEGLIPFIPGFVP